MYDGHCFNARAYYKDKVEAILGPSDNSIEFNLKFKEACETNKSLKDIRQDSKGPTFGLAYGAMPPKVAKTIGCSLAEAQQIYNAYHYELYNGVRNYIDKYVLAESKATGEMYCVLGMKIKTNNPDKDIRTLHNATIQSFSVLTLMAVANLQTRIDEAGYQTKVIITNTIYDAIYLDVINDPFYIDWVNTNLLDCMLKPYLIDALVPNDAECEIGPDLAHQSPYQKEPNET